MAEKLSEEGKKHVERVMRLFERRRLRSSDGKTVTDKERALAIGHSEARAIEERGKTVRSWEGRSRIRPKKA